MNNSELNNRVDIAAVLSSEHWSQEAANLVRSRFPKVDLFTCAAGISPSGVVHFGNFRDVVTAFMVLEALRAEGSKGRLIFSWDNYDRFRKVPAGVDASFEQHLGKPLSAVPDPWGKYESYAEHFQAPFESAMKELGIELDYRYQTKEYQSGRYDDQIIQCLKARREIAEVLLSFMSDKGKGEKGINPAEYREKYYPISLYSRFSGKDNTQILDFDGEASVTYRCHDTKQDETINIREVRCVKLAWKIDWPMRWGAEGVVFEPGGRDHATPGGSYDVSRVIAEKIFARPAPVFMGYEFIGIQGLGAKMSGSKGNVVSPADLLEIYEPSLLKWLYARKAPHQGFNLAFDSEILRQYDEFDREIAEIKTGKAQAYRQAAIRVSFGGKLPTQDLPPIPFKQAVALGQTVQWNPTKVSELAAGLGMSWDQRSVEERLSKARTWLEKYNPGEVLSLRGEKNLSYCQNMSPQGLQYVRTLRAELEKGIDSVEALEHLVYNIPKDPNLSQKENAPRQRAFFKDVYSLLLGKDTGPRLSTFLWAVNRQQVLELLNV